VKGKPVEFGPYRIVRRLAAGGMGEVFLAKLQRAGGFQKEVAVKSIHPKYMTNPRFIEFFEREARLAALLNHRHIVQIFDFGRDETRVWLAMEYVEGVDLKTVMTKLDGPLPLRVCLDVILAVAQALHYAHRAKDGRGKRLEIVHRDISPQNILFSFEGDVKVADFGLAHAAALGPDRDRSLKGKYAYMSPEQISGIPVDARTDQFSLGTVFYEILAGQRAFHHKDGMSETLSRVQVGSPGDGLEALRGMVPDVVVNIVERALRPNRTERFPDLGVLVDAVRTATSQLAERAPPVDLSEWLKETFPNRKVSIGSTTVEATRTALAEEPIVTRDEEQSVAMEPIEMAVFANATTGSHRADITSYPSQKNKITQSMPAVTRTIFKIRWSSAVVVIMSALLTAGLLSYLVLPRATDSALNSTQNTPAVLPVVALADAQVSLKTPGNSDAQPIPLPDLGGAPSNIDFGLQAKDAQAPLDKVPSATADSRKLLSKRKLPKGQSPTISKGSKRADGLSSKATSVAKRKSPPKVEQAPPKQTLKADVGVMDAAVPIKQPPAQKVAEPSGPAIKLLTSGLTFNTKAKALTGGGHRISDKGDLFQVRVNGIKISLRLSAPRGRFLLSAQARPWANIIVDGRKLGGTPLAAFPLASGSHEIKFNTTDGKHVALRVVLSR
jgi:serine/threonine protein kinase